MKISLTKRTVLAIALSIIASTSFVVANAPEKKKKPTITPLFKAVQVLETRIKDDFAHTITLHALALEELIQRCFSTKDNASPTTHSNKIKKAIEVLEKDAQLVAERIAQEADNAKKIALTTVHTILSETAQDLRQVCAIIEHYKGVTNIAELIAMAQQLFPYKKKGLLPASLRNLTPGQLKDIFQHRMSQTGTDTEPSHI